MKHPNLTNNQLNKLDSLFELVSQRQINDFGNISASNKSDGSLITSCDLWSDKTIVDGIASIAPDEGVLSEEGGKSIPNTEAYWVVDPLDGTTNFAAGIPYWSISVARFVDGRPESSFLIIPTLKKKFVSIKDKGVWLNNKKIYPNQNNYQSECISLCSRSIKILQKNPNSVFPGKIRLLGVSSLNLTSVAMGQTFGAIESTPKIWDIAAAWLLLEELNCSIEWLETDPLNLVSGENLSNVNFPLIAGRSMEKIRILKPWGNLLLEK